MAKDLVPLRLEIAGMANRLFELVGMLPLKANEKQRQKLAAYAFGMAFALGQEHGLEPAEVHGLVISYLRDVFKYTDLQVVQFADLLIQAAQNPSSQPVLHAISQRGIDGYTLLKKKKIDRLREVLEQLLGLSRQPAPAPAAAAPKPQFRAERERVYKDLFGLRFTVDKLSGPEEPRIDVYTFEPGFEERDYYTLVTSGLSDLPMQVPEGGSGPRAELILYVKEPKGLYVHVLHWLARIPHDQERWYGPGTTMNNGNPPEPIFDGSKLDCFLFLQTDVEPDRYLREHLILANDPVHFLWLVPITKSECALVLKRSPKAFLDLMAANKHPIVLDERRRSYKKSKRD